MERARDFSWPPAQARIPATAEAPMVKQLYPREEPLQGVLGGRVSPG